MKTQVERLLEWVSDGAWHCGSEFLEGHFYTFSQRASEVNAKDAGRIMTRPCQQHHHPMYQYADRDARKPTQLQLAG